MIVSDLLCRHRLRKPSVMSGEIVFRKAEEAEREEVLAFLREHFFTVREFEGFR